MNLEQSIETAKAAIAALEAMKAPDAWAKKSETDRRGIDKTLAEAKKQLETLEAKEKGAQ